MDGMTGSGVDQTGKRARTPRLALFGWPGARGRQNRQTEDQPDARADRSSFAIVAALVLASLLIEATSLILDGNRDLVPFGWWTPFLLEGSSHVMLLALFPLVPAIMNTAPLTTQTWQWALPIHVLGFFVFSLAHVASFVAIRTLVFVALGETYTFGIGDPWVWLYELRKDALTYTLFVVVVALNRAAHYRRLERAAATDDAREGGRITLRCGGRMLRLRSEEIDAASAAGNYVEVACGSKRYLARTTLAALEELLAAAGSQHMRIHRSHIVNLDAVREVVPVGTGEAVARLASGAEVPVSRRHRDKIADVLSQPSAIFSKT